MPEEDRQLKLHAPKLPAEQQLMVRRIEGREAISELFHYEVTLYSESGEVDFSKVLGQEMCIGLTQPRKGADPERFFHGYVASFASLGSEEGYHVYRAELRPHFWRLTRTVNSRGFQGETVTAIVESILSQLGIAFDSHYTEPGDYKAWEYCVQYRESDFAFISRLLEHEGIHYFFKHEKEKHTLVLSDGNPGDGDAIKGYGTVEFTQPGNIHNRREESAWNWTRVQRVLPDRTSVKDYDFTKPTEDFLRTSSSEINREHDDARNYEVYDWLETFVQQANYSAESSERYARIRTTELHTQFDVATFHTDARGLCAGYPFKFKNGPTTHKNLGFLVIASQLHAEVDLRGSSSGGSDGMVYECTLDAIDLNNPYRPARVTPKPRIPGPQSAIVAGPAGAKDHHTDQWGRVFVKFHWYRPPGEKDRDISFWIRVSQNSAGANWGSMFVPHIGQEVIVSFYEGDPDRPVVTGRVYNGNNKPPYELPGNAYKSTIRDHFSNEITFDGTPGDEHLFFYSPSHRSALILGKSVQDFTTSKKKSYSYDSESYHFGTKLSYTKGSSFSVDRGFFASVKAGVGASLTVGTDLKLGAAANIEFKGGVSVSLSATSSFSFGYGREFKTTKGTYRRSSSEDAVLDSQKTVFITGGENDNTMLASNDKELTLSYDDGVSIRVAQTKMADGRAKAALALVTGTAAALSLAGAGLAQFEITRKGEQRSPDDSIKTIRMDTDNVSGMALSDIPLTLGAAASVIGPILATKGIDIESPEHPTPSAKIRLSKEIIELFAGKQRESELILNKKTGMALTAKKKIDITSDKEVNVKSGTAIKLNAENAVIIAGAISHANLKVSK